MGAALEVFLRGVCIGTQVPYLIKRFRFHFPKASKRIDKYFENHTPAHWLICYVKRPIPCCREELCQPCVVNFQLVEKDVKRLFPANSKFTAEKLDWTRRCGQVTLTYAGDAISVDNELEKCIMHIGDANELNTHIAKNGMGVIHRKWIASS